MLSANQTSDADRIALTNMFRAIAEYGRTVRQRRQAESEKAKRYAPEQSKKDLQDRPCAADQRNELMEIDPS